MRSFSLAPEMRRPRLRRSIRSPPARECFQESLHAGASALRSESLGLMGIGDLTLADMRTRITRLRPFLLAGGAALLLVAAPAHHHAVTAAGPSRRIYTIPTPGRQA